VSGSSIPIAGSAFVAGVETVRFAVLHRTSTGSGISWASSGRSERAQILAVEMVGDQQGIAGKAMPEIPSLDMPLPEASTEGSQLAFRSSAE